MDLIERLRKADPKSAQRAVGSSILGEAADEIERLRKALEWIKSIAELDDTTQLVEFCAEALAHEQAAPRKEQS